MLHLTIESRTFVYALVMSAKTSILMYITYMRSKLASRSVMTATQFLTSGKCHVGDCSIRVACYFISYSHNFSIAMIAKLNCINYSKKSSDSSSLTLSFTY